MAEASFYIGVIGNVISVLVFLSPVETFWKIVKRKSTEEYKSLPYICTLLGSSPWTYYGIVTPGEYLVSTVNGFGALVEIIYVSLFVLYAPRHLKVPNGVGFVFGTMQLILYGIYRNAKPVGSSKGWSDIVADEEKGLTSRVPLLT
ncbi:hypothetical protein Bca52824_075407 [Brassica carinata]|uniref:Uncharacterized protein n=1 Tax=Brassica carinata TaxID=52824 RepID=A0A8X7PT00_BRACI|nr:hypothetical protein Bca52824_075407 [Brassica carinata]